MPCPVRLYTPLPPRATRPATELILTMSATWRGLSWPRLQQVRQRRVRAVQRPSTLSSTIRCHSTSGAPMTGPSSITPALLTSVSRRPSSATVRPTASVRLLLVRHVGLEHDRGAALPADAAARCVEPVLRRAASATAAPGRRVRWRSPRRSRSRPGDERTVPSSCAFQVRASCASSVGAFDGRWRSWWSPRSSSKRRMPR